MNGRTNFVPATPDAKARAEQRVNDGLPNYTGRVTDYMCVMDPLTGTAIPKHEQFAIVEYSLTEAARRRMQKR